MIQPLTFSLIALISVSAFADTVEVEDSVESQLVDVSIDAVAQYYIIANSVWEDALPTILEGKEQFQLLNKPYGQKTVFVKVGGASDEENHIARYQVGGGIDGFLDVYKEDGVYHATLAVGKMGYEYMAVAMRLSYVNGIPPATK